VFSFSLFFGWGLMVGVFYLLFFLFRFTGLEAQLKPHEHRLYLIAYLLYAPLETAVQWMGQRGSLPKGAIWINRIEHFSWAAVLTIFFLPILAPIWKRLNGWQNLLFILSFVCFLGNLNEFLEFITRIQHSTLDPVQFSAFYSDTIYDMLMNLLGGLLGLVILKSIMQSTPQISP
jgi:glycopeptide antibiotics resistance protein